MTLIAEVEEELAAVRLDALLGLGEVNADRLAKLQEFYVAKGFIQKATPVDELYTNAFIK